MGDDTTVRNDYLIRLDGLMRAGRELKARLAADESSRSTAAAVRLWQQDCAGVVNRLSGGSKAHWLARAFSDAFLVRSVAGQAVREAPLAEIVDRITSILEQAARSLSLTGDDWVGRTPATQGPRRFEFVHNVEIRPLLEQAYANGRDALEAGRFAESLIATCAVLDAIITDALEAIGRQSHEWSFEARIDAAEQAGLIGRGCARLPPLARRYRDLMDADGKPRADATLTARDARVAGQVLHVVMRDLSPGR